MTRRRAALLDELTVLIPEPGAGRVALVAVDGVDGSGKTTFADAWARRIRRSGMPCARIRLDRYLAPRAVRHARGRDDPEGFWLDSYDYAAFNAEVLEPLRPRADTPPTYRPGVYDVVTETPRRAPRHTAPMGERGGIVLIDGIFLHRDDLHTAWDFSVWLEVSFEVTFARMAGRDGCPADPHHPANARYLGGQLRYFGAARPWLRADVIVDNTEPGGPVLGAPALRGEGPRRAGPGSSARGTGSADRRH